MLYEAILTVKAYLDAETAEEAEEAKAAIIAGRKYAVDALNEKDDKKSEAILNELGKLASEQRTRGSEQRTGGSEQ